MIELKARGNSNFFGFLQFINYVGCAPLILNCKSLYLPKLRTNSLYILSRGFNCSMKEISLSCNLRSLTAQIHTLKQVGILIFLALTIISCGNDGEVQKPEPISEGVIIYELTYPQFKEDNIFTSMFPNEMAFKFKDNNTKSELKTSMAVFSTALLAEKNKKTLTHLVRIASKYSGLVMDSTQIVQEYGKMPDGMIITPTSKTKTIAGYVCKNALITFSNDTTKIFDVYYTDEIGIEDPNWCTPYHEIKGVLMEATVNKFNIDMHMVAKSVTGQKFEESEFQITQKFQPITVEEMADIFQSF
jgi:hypothetical protein